MQQVAGRVAMMLFWALGLTTMLLAQQPGVHYWHQGAMPPGAIGSRQLERGGPLPGYFQPVEIKAPPGALISLAAQDRFEEPRPGPREVGLLIGAVYRLRVTGIHLAEGLEVFPTIEIIDRLYPPIGQELRFPIHIELNEIDLKLALNGKFVTRVIYLEDPRDALPASSFGQEQIWFDVRPGQDPLAVADGLGRPVAILRMGGRVPETPQQVDPSFLYGCPPFVSCPCEAPKTAETEVAQHTAAKKNAAGVKLLPPPPRTGSITPTSAVSSCPLEPTVSEQGAPLPLAAYPPWTPPGIGQPWPEDEYLRDGGDGGVPLGVGREREVLGLETEDAAAVYDTLDGRTIVEPSNEVYIYSPRFGSVRQIVGLVANEQRAKLSDVYLTASLAKPTLTQKVGAAKQQVQTGSEVSARPAQAFRMRQGDGALSSVIGPYGFQDAFKPYENLAIIRQGAYENAEKALLARGIQAAIAWQHTQAVQVILDKKGAMALAQNQQSDTIFVATVPPGKPKLRIVKVASTPYAQPGDLVWFTIRFDNVGNQKIGNVTIIDSLSPRLEYLEGSAQCSRAAQFSTKPNAADSLVVRCEITDPLEPGQGGLVRFCCKVR
jgi:uncharacterized repeat protein (TIGR01451 family)